MNKTRVLSTAMLFLLPGTIATAYAQEHEQEKQPAEHQQQAKPAQQKEQAKPAQQKQQAKPAKQQPQAAQHEQQAKPAKQPQQAAQHEQKAKPAKQPQQAAQHKQQAKPAQQQQRAQGQQQAGRGQSAGGHGSIPEAKFHASFGSGHTFHVNRSEWASGSGRFQYGGYWFNAVDPWPVGWLYTDNVYVDYMNGGYFLCDPVHPGVYISINIG